MADNPWSNKQQQMVQEYLDALLTDPDAVDDAEQLAEDVTEGEVTDAVIDDHSVQPAEEALVTSEEHIQAEDLVVEEQSASDDAAEEAIQVSELADDIDLADTVDSDVIAAMDDSESEPVAIEEAVEDSLSEDAPVAAELSDDVLPADCAEAEDEILSVVDAEPEAEIVTEAAELLPEPEEALDAALHAIESVKAAEAAEAEEFASVEELASAEDDKQVAEDTAVELIDDCTAEDGVSTINDPISVAAELLHEELDHFESVEESESSFAGADIDPFDDIPVLTAGMETQTASVAEVEESAEPEVEDLAETEGSVGTGESQSAECEDFEEEFESQQVAAFPADDLEAYVNDINGVTESAPASAVTEHHEIADEQDIAALLSQLAEIVSDASVAEAVIRKVEEIAAEFSVSEDSVVSVVTDDQVTEAAVEEAAVVSEAVVEDVISEELLADEPEVEGAVEEEVVAVAELADPDEAIEFPVEDDFMSEEEIAAGFAEAMAEEQVEAATDEVVEPEPVPVQVAAPAVAPEPEPEPAEDLQCIIVEMHGLQLAMPLQHVLEPRHIADMSLVLDDQYDWVLGSFLDLNFKVDVVDTAMWLIPERYEPHNATYDEILLLQDKPWALTYDRMITAQIIGMDDITLNTDKTRRPWLLGTSMTHKCAVVDIPALCKQLEEAL